MILTYFLGVKNLKLLYLRNGKSLGKKCVRYLWNFIFAIKRCDEHVSEMFDTELKQP